MITFADEPPERCAICKLYLLRHHKEQWIGLTTEDGGKAWLCKKCFNIPVEDFFIPKDYERRKKDKDDDFWTHRGEALLIHE